MVSSRKDLKLLCNPSCDSQNLFRLGAAINFDRYANENSLPPPPAARRLTPARSACRGFISFDLKPKQKDTRRCLFVLAGAEELEPRNSKVLALLTVNSPVDCLRIELLIKPLPNKYQMVQQFDHFCPMWSIVIF